MAIFAIIAQPSQEPSKLPSEIARKFSDGHLQLREGNWLVSFSGTAKELSDQLEVTDGKTGSAVIVEVSSYYGRASTNIWSWIRTKWEASNG